MSSELDWVSQLSDDDLYSKLKEYGVNIPVTCKFVLTSVVHSGETFLNLSEQ